VRSGSLPGLTRRRVHRRAMPLEADQHAPPGRRRVRLAAIPDALPGARPVEDVADGRRWRLRDAPAIGAVEVVLAAPEPGDGRPALEPLHALDDLLARRAPARRPQLEVDLDAPTHGDDIDPVAPLRHPAGVRRVEADDVDV